MRHRYQYLDPDLLRAMAAELDLMRLFQKLLLMVGGDVAEAKRWLRELQRQGVIPEGVDADALLARLEEENLVERDASGEVVLSAAGRERMRRSAFEEVFGALKRGETGYHPVVAAGEGVERLGETRPWQFGDEVSSIDGARSTENALRRTMGGLELTEEDLEVAQTEHLTSCATIIAIDISHSMVLYGEDRITPAKTVALALAELITTSYPKDHLGVLVFGDRAQRIDIGEITAIQAGPYHTNTCEALQMGRRMLAARKQPNKQIVLITDGKPSAITEGDEVYKNPYGLDLRIVNRTLEEAEACRRHHVVITTFMIATDPPLQQFVEQLTKVNRGRAYFASPDRLGEFVLADYIRNRRRRVS
jgi:Ca-activated chloride channel homolog